MFLDLFTSKFTGTARVALVVVSIFAASSAGAQTWPDKSITLVAPFPPGGTTDILARAVAQNLQLELGQTVVVQNKPGAGGTLGTGIAARAPADGYTLVLSNVGNTAAGMLYADLPFNFDSDFTHITTIAVVPNVLIVTKSSPYDTLEQLLADTKKHPGQVNFGSAGVGTPQHLNAELVAKQAGLKIVHVPYKGASPMMTDLIAGRVTFSIDTAGSAISQMNAGMVKALAVTSLNRAALLPAVPTIAESAGFAGFQATTWYGIEAPKGLPDAIKEKIYRAVVAMLKRPEMIKTLDGMAALPGGMPPAEYATFVTQETKRWEALAEVFAATKQ
jgi:tripartite-type tricarboxylate transporter receptor subunit TctC